jgi:hypothetical protein
MLTVMFAMHIVMKYDDRGYGLIECHHNRPVSEMDGEGKVRLDDLSLLTVDGEKSSTVWKEPLIQLVMYGLRLNKRLHQRGELNEVTDRISI